MKEFLDVAAKLVKNFLAAKYEDAPLPKGLVFIEDGKSRSACGQTFDDSSYLYCPEDERVYIGQKQLWEFYSEFGAVAPVFGLAHEYGHHLQHLAGVGVHTQRDEISSEDQADCIGGAWTDWADSENLIDYPKDLANLDGVLKFIADAEGPQQTHGTPSERAKAFSRGFADDIEGCNSYFKETPLIKVASPAT